MLRVLVVDDDPDIRAMVCLALGSEFSVARASNGSDALAALAVETFDVMVLDVQMPGCDGWTVLETVRRQRATADLGVVMATVKARPEDREHARRLGCDGYLTKPFSITELSEQVRAAGSRRIGRASSA